MVIYMFNDVMKILSMEAFSKFVAGGIVQAAEINTAVNLLLGANIPFDVIFSPSNKRFAKQVLLIIYITPAITIEFSIQFEGGQLAL